MSGYLIVIIVMLIMFVALMIQLLQEPHEEPLMPSSPPSRPAYLVPDPEAVAPHGVIPSATTAETDDDPLERLDSLPSSELVPPDPIFDPALRENPPDMTIPVAADAESASGPGTETVPATPPNTADQE